MQPYEHKKVEARVGQMWVNGNYFTPGVDPARKPYSIFLVPPNASGKMHIGNMLMIALQDILARYHRAKGESTLWIPSTDHGGYETQVTFERELEKVGKSRLDYHRNDLFTEIKSYVKDNSELIKSQIKAMGASVDWSRFRFTMDERAIDAAEKMFRKMVSDNLIYRHPYMVNYCSLCGTVLADIELSEQKETIPLYFIKFPVENSEEYVTLATARPEFIFAVTHVLVHQSDTRYAHHIGKILKNPVTGHSVEVVASKRKFDPAECEPYLFPFSPSYNSYDYGYALRNSLPSRNLLDWDGNMIERYPGFKPVEARAKEISFLKEQGAIEKTDESYTGSVFLCKRGHTVESMITLTWFLKLDDEKKSLKKPAIETLKKGGVTIFPRWREKGLIGWLEKMHDWPIARQNVWGIRIPIWYDISDPSQFTVWFFDRAGKRQYGNLKSFLDAGLSLEELAEGLERIYAHEGASWILEREAGKPYLPETDTFDTWFSSGDWSTVVFGDLDSPDFSYFYPSESLITGHDLLRLFVSREIFLGLYVAGRLPFKIVYFHRLIKGSDGQKMSKSLGNAVNPEELLEIYGADVTRMALVSYTTVPDDFIFEEERLLFYQKFSSDLWNTGDLITLANQYSPEFSESLEFSPDDREVLAACNRLAASTGSHIEKYSFAFAQERLCGFLPYLGDYAMRVQQKKNVHISLSVLRYVFAKYITMLHPFMPFMTEELYTQLYNPSSPLAVASWPKTKR